jgi:hypothetical protein
VKASSVALFLISLASVVCVAPRAEGGINVALDADVTLHGTFFSGGWGGGAVVDKQTIVDGVFLPRSTQWDQGAVWWDGRVDGGNQYITIDFGATCLIDSLILQADDNDEYILAYYKDLDGVWQELWNAPAVGGWGMQTRPNPLDNNERYMLPNAVTTTALKIAGNAPASDLYFSVSEIQAFGSVVPEPASIAVWSALGLTVIGFGSWRRRRKS